MDDPRTYGDSFADVYDEWYGDVTDAEATARFVAERCGGRPVLELGIGTGRLARPLAARDVVVIGLDASAVMLAEGADSSTGATIPVVQADMVALPFGSAKVGGSATASVNGGGFGAVLVAFNTLFNLTSEEAQQALFREVEPLLARDGVLIIEVLETAGLGLGPRRSMAVARRHEDGVTVVATNLDPEQQLIIGQHIDIRDGGVRHRPWLLRWSSAEQLDRFAARAGLEPVERHADWDEAPHTETSPSHITVYRRPTRQSSLRHSSPRQ